MTLPPEAPRIDGAITPHALHPKVEIAKEQLAHQRRDQDLGTVGRFLGSREQVVTYFAIIAAGFFGAMIVYCMFATLPDGLDRKEAVQWMFTLFGSTAGYAYGSSGAKQSDR